MHYFPFIIKHVLCITQQCKCIYSHIINYIYTNVEKIYTVIADKLQVDFMLMLWLTQFFFI